MLLPSDAQEIVPTLVGSRASQRHPRTTPSLPREASTDDWPPARKPVAVTTPRQLPGLGPPPARPNAPGTGSHRHRWWCPSLVGGCGASYTNTAVTDRPAPAPRCRLVAHAPGRCRLRPRRVLCRVQGHVEAAWRPRRHVRGPPRALWPGPSRCCPGPPRGQGDASDTFPLPAC